MKKLGLFSFLILLLSLSLPLSSSAFAGVKDSIELKGTVYNNKDRVKGLVISIYKNNDLFKEVKVRSGNKFRTYLPANAILTIEISSPGCYPKRLIFDSHLPENLSPMPRYEFDIDIFKEDELANVNTSILDFPVGIVVYDEKKGDFVRNKKYTKKMKKAYLKLWEEAQMANRSGLEETEEKKEK
jgi:hypothetical protein